MSTREIENQVRRRRTFAIISHPDAGKTTVTEKLLLLAGAINSAGTVKAKKSGRYATSDWMEIEKQRGISVTSSVMQFEHSDCVVNLLDTPGHEDFSEDTYRTLTAVDSALMVIDAARGVEDRTVKLLEVCRLRNTPIITLVNKLDRYARDPLDLLDEIEDVLKIKCAPVTWPLGSGQHFDGIYDFRHRCIRPYRRNDADTSPTLGVGVDIDAADAKTLFPDSFGKLIDEIELLEGAGTAFDNAAYLRGEQTPMFFASALHNFGIREMLDTFVAIAPGPSPRQTDEELVDPATTDFSGFVFKIQANMDPNHHDRIAFVRVCSGQFAEGKRIHHVRLDRSVQISNAVSFMAQGRDATAQAWAGYIIGFHNHGTMQIGDIFTEGKKFRFQGIPNFAPELFRRVRAKDPLKGKALQKGLTQLCEEGAAQVFNRVDSNDIVLGAVGLLQFDVVAWRLEYEYGVDCIYEPAPIKTARWVRGSDAATLERFRARAGNNVAIDGSGEMVYLAPTLVNLQLTSERWPQVEFHTTREVVSTQQLERA